MISAYFLTISRVVAWAGVSALVFRRSGADGFAILVLLRGTITLISYTSLGLGPAMVRMLAQASRQAAVESVKESAADSDSGIHPVQPQEAQHQQASSHNSPALILSYARPPDQRQSTAEQRVYAAGCRLAFVFTALAFLAAVAYCNFIPKIHVLSPRHIGVAEEIVLYFGFGVMLRILSEPSSALIQSRGFLSADNLILAVGECLWLGFVLVGGTRDPASAAVAWFAVSLIILAWRPFTAARVAGDLLRARPSAERSVYLQMIGFGGAVVVAQLADFLYAPTDYILINRLLNPDLVAVYAPAVQLDGALLLIVGGIATVLFPHTARAHAAGDLQQIRRDYLRGTTISAVALLLAGGCLLLVAKPLFQIWLGQDLPDTRAILPLMLIHTVVGGSSGVGRSILLGMGKIKAFTLSVLIAGVANVILSALFASAFGWGLKGIVLGTTVTVVGRCALWMPWYVMRSLKPS